MRTIPALSTVLLLAGIGLGAPVRSEEPVAPAPAVKPSPDGVWLGVWLTDLVDGGVEVVALAPDGPAREAGVRSGDVILEVNRSEVGNRLRLGQLLDELRPGETLDVGLLRSGRMIRLPVRLGRRLDKGSSPRAPDPPEPWRPGELLGLRVSEITPALRKHYGAPEEYGVLVVRVLPGRIAERAGIRVGDVLIRAAGKPVVSESQVRSNLVAWTAQRPLRLDVVRDGGSLALELPAEQLPAPPGPPAPPAARRRIELEIDRLERRLQELRRELALLAEEGERP